MTHKSSLHEELKQLLDRYDEKMEIYEKHYHDCKEVYDAVLNIPFVKNLKAENEFLRNSMEQISNSLTEEHMNPKYIYTDEGETMFSKKALMKRQEYQY